MQWIVNGKELSEEEFKEHRRKDLEEKQRTQDEAQRLIAALGEAYKTCTEFLARHAETPYPIKDAQAQEHALLQKLRQSLERADRAPRCEKVREDGTVCGSPQMKGYRYCYAHERMLQTQSQKLQLPALEDANAVQMAIMRVQKALIDDEISEKKAGLLLYSLQMASSNLKHTTFSSKEQKDVVTEMRESPGVTSRVSGKANPEHPPRRHGDTEKTNLPLMNADGRGLKPAVSNQRSALSSQHSARAKANNLPRINADGPGSGKRLPELPKSPESGTGNTLPLMNTDQADLR